MARKFLNSPKKSSVVEKKEHMVLYFSYHFFEHGWVFIIHLHLSYQIKHSNKITWRPIFQKGHVRKGLQQRLLWGFKHGCFRLSAKNMPRHFSRVWEQMSLNCCDNWEELVVGISPSQVGLNDTVCKLRTKLLQLSERSS